MLIVAIAGAAGQIGYSFLPMVASGEVFGPNQRVIIRGLDLNLPQTRDNMKASKYELQDGNFPLLEQISMHIDETEAFNGADYVVLLGSWPQTDRKSKKDIVEMNHLIFRTMGRALDQFAKKTCKVIVVGAPASTNALICSHYAISLKKENFTAISRVLHNRVLGQLAARCSKSVGDVQKIAVWGGASTATGNPPSKTTVGQFVDLDHCTVGGRNLSEVLSRDEDKKWLAESLMEEVMTRGQTITDSRKAAPALSAARAICDHVRLLHRGAASPNDFVCMGIWTDGKPYDISDGLFVSMPVRCKGQGSYEVVKGLSLSTKTRDKLKQAERELIDDRDLAQHFFKTEHCGG